MGLLMALPPVSVEEMVEGAQVVARVEVRPFERVSKPGEAPERWRTTLEPLQVYKGQLSGPVELTIEVRPDTEGEAFVKPPEAGERVAFLRKRKEQWTLADPCTQALRKVTPSLLRELGASEAGQKR